MNAVRLLAALLFLGLNTPVVAQQSAIEDGPSTDGAASDESGPRLAMALDEDSAIPGQPIVLRLKILVPTYLPKPPVFPSFEVPGVMVRLPERASGPTSETIDGATWAGVMRSYRLLPMVPGQFRIPARPLTVTYADPDTNEPIAVEMMTDEVVFEGVVPKGAEDLDPFIAAENLVLDQQVNGDPENMAPGDSVERVVVASITGTSPLFVPPLIPAPDSNGVAAYPAEPRLEESENRGVFSGKRTERVTYVAESGGRAVAPAVALRWFNIKSNKVETANAPEIDFVVSGAPVASETGFDWRAIAPWIVGGLVLLTLLIWVVWLCWPRVSDWRRRRHEAWLASEPYAYHQAELAIRRRDFSETSKAITRWSARLPAGVSHIDAGLSAAMTRLGARIYGREETASEKGQSSDWNHVRTALRAARNHQKVRAHPHGHVLPPLNPVG